MTFPQPALFAGDVVHRRVSPVRHKLRYRVFSVLADLEDIGSLKKRCRLLSHNCFNVLSLHDADFGDGANDNPAHFVRDLVKHRLGFVPDQVLILTFPRVFGYAFNPLTTYFCLAGGIPAAVVYEVNNTFGGRIHYACAVSSADGVQTVEPAGKRLLVSPFNGEHGRYGFRLRFDSRLITLGVALKEAGKPILNTSYAAARIEATDANILRLVTAMPFMTLKVIAGIHLEAARLWLKGLRPPRPLGQVLHGRHDKLLGAGETQPDLGIRKG